MPDTQLPAEALPKEWLEEIELKAEHEAALQFNPAYSPDQNMACRICYRNGAKEYADLALLSIKEEVRAKRITEQALLSRSRAMKEYATKLHQAQQEKEEERQQRVHLAKENYIITGHYNDLQKQYSAARALLEKVIYRHEGGLLPDRLLYNDIKTFLDGTK
jgi:hypothetical protein